RRQGRAPALWLDDARHQPRARSVGGRRVRRRRRPGREREFATLFKQALDYVTAIGGCQIHCLAGKVPPEQRPVAEMTFIRNLAGVADAAQEKNITLLIEPINPRDRPDYFLTRAEQAAH